MGKAEGKIENYLRDKAKSLGFMCLKFVSPSLDGVPDRVLIGHGLVFFVETKAPGEKIRRLQESVIRQFREQGALVYVADTEDLVDRIFEDIQPLLQKKPVDTPIQ